MFLLITNIKNMGCTASAERVVRGVTMDPSDIRLQQEPNSLASTWKMASKRTTQAELLNFDSERTKEVPQLDFGFLSKNESRYK